MRAVVACLLVALALAKADVNWENVFPKHILDYPRGSIPHGIPSPRITGGEESVPNSNPAVVGLMIPVSGGTAFCGGTLISTQTVLTAAHCVDSLVGPVEVILGAHRIRESEPTQVRMFSSGIVVHPQWSSLTLRNDIALIRLPSPVTLTAAIQIISLPTDTSNSFEGHQARAVGWGRDSDDSATISDVLRQVDIPVIANSVCNIAYFGVIDYSHICASGLGGRSTCNGDSGGPLTIAGVQVGITSFGIALGCEVGWPPVFTRVTSFVDWINAHLI